MFKYAVKRFIWMIFTLTIITFMCFVLVRMLPPAELPIGDPHTAVIEARREAAGYNKPYLIQFGIYVRDIILEGDWGVSDVLYFGQDVWSIFIAKLPATMIVNLYSIILSIPFGIILGIIAAIKKNTWVDHSISTLTMVCISVPSFVYAFIIQYFVSYKLGNFYRTALRCTQYGPNPIVLSDTQEKIFMSCEIHYKNAVGCTMNLAKQGNLHALELHSTTMNELSVLYTAVGKYEEALKVARDGIRIDKSIYEKINDKTRCFLYGNRLNNFATIYLVSKDYKNAMEIYETSIIGKTFVF